MGEVYRGRDTKLGRDVAVKALPSGLSKDSERLARFEREAQILASLNHPNIAIIHELKEVDGAKYLIMELIEGQTLAERIVHGPVPMVEALSIARQIAEALEAAHDKGIIHRDLKPANVQITPEGRAKVLDFGLAKINESDTISQNLSNSPTLVDVGTARGLILGTAAYMSPEQARGKNVDRRADVWAFGCVLYEMLTGRQTFPNGETVSDTLAGILTREPDWQALPHDTPPRIRTLLERCLQKDVRRRRRDMAENRIDIEEAEMEYPATDRPSVAQPSRRREYVLSGLLVVLLLATAALALRAIWTPLPDATAVRFEISPPNSAGLTPTQTGLELSPDGRKLAFIGVSQSRAQIWVRSLDAAEAQPLPATEGLDAPSFFWSPDSQYIAFFKQGKLNKVSATGGPAQVVCSLPGGGYIGGTWNTEGVILLGRGTTGPIVRVPAGGGEPTPATELDASRGETRHAYPSFLPDGHHFLYVAQSVSTSERIAYVGTLDSKERHALPGIASAVKYSSTGRVLFIRVGSLMAQPFDIKRLELSGEAFSVAELGMQPGALSGPYSVSGTGALAYRAGVPPANQNTQLAWFDRKGKQLALVGPSGEYFRPSLSPDGNDIVFERGSPSDIWVMDIRKGVTSRLVSRPEGGSTFPVWSPDGRSIAFTHTTGMYERAFGVVGEDKLLMKAEPLVSPTDWSRDGRYIIGNNVPSAPYDLWALPLFGDRKQLRVTETPFNEVGARISPDGHWIAYLSDESPGPRFQLYIQSFPEPGRKLQVSTNGAFIPRWGRDGKELFYVEPDLTLMAVPIKYTGSSLEAGAPTRLFKAPIDSSTLGNGRSYDVAEDGRFLINVVPAAASQARASAPITVILNWAAGLKK
jgi:Tol biopolymer transport system component